MDLRTSRTRGAAAQSAEVTAPAPQPEEQRSDPMLAPLAPSTGRVDRRAEPSAGRVAALASLAALELDRDDLQHVRSVLRARIKRGLVAAGQEIAALPAFIGMPDASLSGEALVLDTGGTNMRAARVRLGGESGATISAAPVKEPVPGRGDAISREQFFDAHRALVARLGGAENLPVGYCFSFGTEVQPDGDARLIRWAKGIQVPDVEGTLVGSALRDALARGGLEPGEVAVLNDTVAALLGGAAAHANDGFADFIGLIAGTGHNIASFVAREDLKKLGDADWQGKMAVNLETGNFAPPHLTRWDKAVDAESENAGFNRFEKAVSGYYLPFLFQKIVPDLPDFDPTVGSSVLAKVRNDPTRPELAQKAAGALLDRSADLVAAALAAVVDLSTAKSGTIGILAEGGLMWRVPGYAERVEKTLDALLEGAPVKARILRLDDANLFGAASAALLKGARSLGAQVLV